MAITAGAGVNPDDVIKPSKRIRNWHRSSSMSGGGLKAYATRLIEDRRALDGYKQHSHEAVVAVAWLASKAKAA